MYTRARSGKRDFRGVLIDDEQGSRASEDIDVRIALGRGNLVFHNKRLYCTALTGSFGPGAVAHAVHMGEPVPGRNG
jgi:hypothetical protein